MKIPTNILPIHVMEDGFSLKGHNNPHRLYATTNDLVMIGDIYQDEMIYYTESKYDALDVAKYICKTSNMFPSINEFLQKLNTLDILDDTLKTELNLLLNNLEV